jgi:signal transduction histidine kinase/ligand-binding sensor domain-containing protein
VCLAAFGGAAFGQYQIDAWTADTGLPIGSANHVLQTQDGYLWLATFAGLVRYNGASFRVFNTGNSTGLRTTRFVFLFEDREGALWAATEGQGLTRYCQGTFRTYTTADGLPEDNIAAVFYDSAGHLLIDSSKGLVEWQNGRFVRSHPAFPSVGDPARIVHIRMASGATWFSDATGLHRYGHEGVTSTAVLHVNIKHVYEDRDGTLWIEHERPGGERVLASYRDGRLHNYGKADGIPRFRSPSATEDREGALWLGLYNDGGLLRFQNGKFARFTKADGLPSDNVARVYQDREGTLWVPTDSGLAWIRRQSVQAYTPAQGLAGGNVYPILQDRHGTIWIGSWPGLTRLEDGRLTEVGGLAQKRIGVMSLLEDHDGALWVGTWGYGALRLKGSRLESVPGAPAVIRAMLQDRAGGMWFGGTYGLARMRNGQFTQVGAADGFAGTHVFSLFESQDGAVWIGTDAGFSRFADGRFTNYSEANGFPGKVVRAFYEDADHVLWLGTYDSGVYRYADGRFTRYTKATGLLDDGAFRILEDKHGNFWMTCNAGVYRVARKELVEVAAGRADAVTSVPYGKPDGMPSAECNGGAQPAGILARDGRLYLPTQKGIAVIDPEAVAANRIPPRVVVEEVLVDGRAKPSPDRIELQPGESSLEIHYAALTFIRPELTQFKYKLEGLDKDWVNAGNRRVAYYSHLPYGNYTFRVIAANRDRIWNLEGASIPARVAAPIWRTPPFALLAAASIFAIGAFAIRRRLLALRREQALHDRFSRQLIDSQERERKRIAAELHDSLSQTLSIIKHRAALSLQNGAAPETVRGQMEEIAAAAGEALAEVREIVHDLRPVEIDRLGLTKAIAAMAKKIAGSTQIRFIVEIDSVDGLFPSNTEINIYRMVQEGLSNIVKHSEADEALLRVRREAAGVEITMRDNGKGFSPHALSAAPGKSGLGLAGLSERSRIIGGRFQAQSTPGSGTTLIVRIDPEAAKHER